MPSRSDAVSLGGRWSVLEGLIRSGKRRSLLHNAVVLDFEWHDPARARSETLRATWASLAIQHQIENHHLAHVVQE